MAWKNLFSKGKRQQIRLSQSQTPTSWSPACCFGKRDACCLTKSSLFGFGVGAMLAGMLTGGWMWNVLSPSLTLNDLLHQVFLEILSCWLIQLPYNPLVWLLGVNNIVFFFSWEWGERGDTRMMRMVHVHYFGMKMNKLWLKKSNWFVWPVSWGWQDK